MVSVRKVIRISICFSLFFVICLLVLLSIIQGHNITRVSPSISNYPLGIAEEIVRVLFLLIFFSARK